MRAYPRVNAGKHPGAAGAGRDAEIDKVPETTLWGKGPSARAEQTRSLFRYRVLLAPANLFYERNPQSVQIELCNDTSLRHV